MHSRTLVLRFSQDIVDQPIITNLVRDYGLTFNIPKAAIFPRKEGMLVMELRGSAEEYFRQRGPIILSGWASRWSRSARGFAGTKRGAVSAGRVRPSARRGAPRSQTADGCRVESERCSACELCVKTCPVRAMIVTFDKALA